MEGPEVRSVSPTPSGPTIERGTSSEGPAGPADARPRSRLAALLGRLVEVREGEADALWRAFLLVFGVLAGNYLIRPARDEMGIAGGTRHLPALFASTLVGMLIAWPLLSARLRGRRRGRVLAWLCRGLQVVLIAFYAAFLVAPGPGRAWIARLFFVWASISNLLLVSVAWGSLAGRFSSGQAARLFGFISAGGTLGAIAGSSLAGALARAGGPALLLPGAALCFELGLLASRGLFRGEMPTDAGPCASDRDAPGPPARPPFDPYLAGLGLWTLLFTSSSAFVYMEQARIVNAAIADPAVRTSLFAWIDLMVNVLGLALQVLVTGRVLGWLGAGGSAAVLPAVTLAGVVVLAMRPTVATVQWFQVARRAIDYAIARPSREVFYTAVDRGELLRTKGLIDTAVYRAGDAAGASAYGLLASVPGLASTAALAVVPLSLGWFALSLALGRALRRRAVAERPRPGHGP